MKKRFIDPISSHLLRQLVVAVFLFHSGMTSAQETEIDTSKQRSSDQGTYVVQLMAVPDPIEISQIHSWVLHVAAPNGQVIENAEISISGGMPRHNHGLPTAPRVTGYLGKGEYLVEGMKFQMTGHWQVTFEIKAGGQQDQVTFNIVL